MKGHLKYVLGILLGVLLVVLFMWNTDWRGFWAAIRGANPGYVAAALALTIFSYVLRAIRWHYLVLPIKRASFAGLFEGIVVGFAVSGLLPGRLGEIVRPYLLSRREKIKMSSLLATVVMDRLLDGFAVLLLLAVYFTFGLDPSGGTKLAENVRTLKAAGGASMAGLLLGGAILALLRFRTEATLRVARALLRPVPARFAHRLLDVLGHFAHGLSVLADLRALLWAGLWSVVIWVEIGVSHYLMIRAFDVQVPFIAVFLLLALMVIGVSIPTPGGMGGLQWTCAFGIRLAAPLTAKPVIDAASMAVWGNSFLPVTAIGLVYLSREGLSLRKIQAISTTSESAAEEDGRAIARK